MFHLFIAFSFSINAQALHLTSLNYYLNLSNSYTTNSNKKYILHPFSLLFSQNNTSEFASFLSKFSYLSSPLLYSFSRNTLNFNLQDSIFIHSKKTITLSSEDSQQPMDYISFDFKSPFTPSSNVIMRACTFNALSSTQGTPEHTTGGAFYSDGFQSTFINCTFIGNTAQRAAACAILNAKAAFSVCHFFRNNANIDIGAILFDHSDVSISDSYFVENAAVLSIGAILGIESSLNFDVVVFHMNHASYQTGALEFSSSKANINVNQFSNNTCLREAGGVSLLANNLSYITLTGCNFETLAKENENKYPIVFNDGTHLTAKMNCFDATEEDIRNKISGNFVNNFNKFGQKCPCNHISFDVPYDVTEINVEVQDKILNPDFFGNIIAILVVTGCILFYMLKKDKNNAFQRL
ncbi:hypothetical protein M9Y10_021677 [Tritrichomonas musculus]|uniref:Right handed beta helix domain-containing protein n=1 Tax=Tritrichomonas musculus TaxID=1915356 RepID=A0ABR2KQ59_9EUKA